MVARIRTFSLVVKDKAKALWFYTYVLGFEKRTDVTVYGHRFVTIGLKGQDLELPLWEMGSPDPTGWAGAWKPGSSPPIGIIVDDCHRVYAELKSRGVKFKQELEENPWGISATFTDPDGNLFSINELPKSPEGTGTPETK